MRARAPQGAQGIKNIVFGPPTKPLLLVRTVVGGSPPNDPRQTTKRPPNDTLETRMARAGAFQGAQGIKNIVLGAPQNRGQGIAGIALDRPPPDNETAPKRYPGNAHVPSRSTPGRPGYQKYTFRTPLTKPRLPASTGSRARARRKRPPPGNETTPKRYPRNAYNTSGSAPGRPWYQKCCFRTPLAKTRLHWTVARGSHPNDPRQTTNAPH